MKLSESAKVNIRFGILITVGVALGVVCVLFPSYRQSGDEVPAPVDGMTSYCLPDSSGIRVFERPFPSGGTQPLFSTVYTGSLAPKNPAYCPNLYGSY